MPLHNRLYRSVGKPRVGASELETRTDQQGAEPNRREQILAAAARLFVAKGYHATSIQDIADAAGLSKPGLYYHCESKEAMLAAVFARYGTQLEAEVDAILKRPVSVRQRLLDLFTATLCFIARHQPGIAVLFREEHSLPPEKFRPIRESQTRYRRKVEALVAEGIANGELRPDLPPKVVQLALAGMLTWSHYWLKPDGEYPPERLASMFASLVLDGMARREAGG